MILLSASKSLQESTRRCYVQYDNESCATCLERTLDSSSSNGCGWCNSLSACYYGNKNGPFKNECPQQDWVFNKSCSKNPPVIVNHPEIFLTMLIVSGSIITGLLLYILYSYITTQKKKLPQFDEILLMASSVESMNV